MSFAQTKFLHEDLMKKSFGISKNLENALSETILIAQENIGKLRVENISLSKIYLDPDNPRQLSITIEDLKNGILKEDLLYQQKEKEKKDLESLAESIKNHDLINPVLVYKNKENYQVVAGERRTLASILCGKTSIISRVLDEKPSPSKIAILQWIENMERKELSLWERLLNLEKIVQECKLDLSAKSISQMLGCSVTQGQAYTVLLKNTNDNLRKLIEDGKINSIDKAVMLTKLEENQLKEMIAQDGWLGLNKKQMKDQISEKEFKKITKRGVKQKLIKMGETKNIKVAKYFWESIKNNNKLQETMNMVSEPDWRNIKEINKTFSDAIYFLEEEFHVKQ